jgi:Domain of unknown function (DUF4263)
MKSFEPFQIDRNLNKHQLELFEKLLTTQDDLSEDKDLRPFFNQNPHFTAAIAEIFHIDVNCLAFEFDLWGDFRCDIAIGDSRSNTYCLVEIEDAKKDSIFKKQDKRGLAEFSARFEHGYSQIVDWYYKIDTLKGNTVTTQERFAQNNPKIYGILLIGRNSSFKDASQFARFEWRTKHVIVNSQTISCFTFDHLLERFKTRNKIYGL